MLAAGGAALAGIAVVRGPARAAQFEFKWGTDLPEDHPCVIRGRQMWAAVERESNGRIHMSLFPNSTLGGSSQMFAQLRVGALQFLTMSPSQVSSVVPAADICYLGFAFKDQNEGFRALDGPLGDYLRQEVTNKGMHTMRTSWNSGMLDVCSGTRPIRTPDDLKGFKVRVAESKIAVDLFKELGANPTALPTGEIYTALQTRLVDGNASPLVTIESGKFYEVQKYISLTHHVWSGPWMVANGEMWTGLPGDLQQLIERANTRFALMERRDTIAQYNTVEAQLRRQGITINEVDQNPFRDRLGAYFKYWAAAFGPNEWGLLQNALGRRLGA